MKDLLSTIEEWTKSGKDFAVSTVVKTWGSSPRPVGSAMIVNTEGEMDGSVSGGCVEGTVAKESANVLVSGEGKRLNYGVTDDEAWAVGLSCGGSISVYTQPFSSINPQVREDLLQYLRSNKSCILATQLVDDKPSHTLFRPSEDSLTYVGDTPTHSLMSAAQGVYRSRQNALVEIDKDQYFLNVFPRRSQMLIIGAAHVTAHLVDLASIFDFETIVIDPRGAYAQRTRFNTKPDQILENYPAEVLGDFKLDPYSFAVILSHDPKIDDNALHILLPSEVAYIGALGSKRTHAKRAARLQNAGFSDEEISRIKAPIGIDINAKTPKEIAMSIMAEIIQVKNT